MVPVGCQGAGDQTDRQAAVQALAAGRPSEAVAGFERACSAGDGPACDGLAKLLSEGSGVAADPVRAEVLHTRACASGVAAGCTNLGALMAGRGQDVEGAELFRQACAAGEVAGCSNLGVMYGLGRGVAQDIDRAAFLARWACSGGDSLACGRVPR